MKIVDEYHERLKQAASVEEKKAIAAELHVLAQQFDSVKRNEYERAMREKSFQVVSALPEIDAVVHKAKSLIAAIEARRSVQV
jgi:uncharacterized Rossmann fold enzyme